MRNETKTEPDLTKKHESDLTKKEKRTLERQKLAAMGFGEKVQYIWMYYKPQMAAVLAVILLIYGGFCWVQRLQQKDILNLVIVNSEIENVNGFTADIRNNLGITDKNEVVSVDTTVSYSADMVDATSNMKLVTLFAASTMDIMILPKELYDSYETEGAFAPLSQVLSEEELAEYSERMLNDDAIQIDESSLNAQYNLTTDAPAYLVVVSGAPHTEYLAQFINYFLQ